MRSSPFSLADALSWSGFSVNESNLLLRSLQRAFYDDPAAPRLVSPETGHLSFGQELEADDVESGTIYVLRSDSDHPYVKQHRDLIHKIGVTSGKVETCIGNAENDSTYWLAKVEVVAAYKLAGINRSRMENLLHKIFVSARLDIIIQDRFGRPVQPQAWFLILLFVIDGPSGESRTAASRGMSTTRVRPSW